MAEKRYFLDCRSHPSEKQCSLYLAGREEEILDAAVLHVVSYHGEADTKELRDQLRESIHEEPEDVSNRTAALSRKETKGPSAPMAH